MHDHYLRVCKNAGLPDESAKQFAAMIAAPPPDETGTADALAAQGERAIHYMGHIRMMSAVQPFLSGAISKTVNPPEDATVENVMEAYTEGWRLGLKALAIYRDGSKQSQPLNTSGDDSEASEETVEATPVEATTGEVIDSGDPTLDGKVSDAIELVQKLAESQRVEQVFVRHVFRYFMGRNETPGDAVSLQEAEHAYLDGGGSFKAGGFMQWVLPYGAASAACCGASE